MTDPLWVSREDVEDLHEIAIEIGGGAQGLRDAALLESALGRPQNQYAYGETDIFQLAASYAEGISRNHPFVDGNKRTAFQTADAFLADNGHDLDKSDGHRHAAMMEKLGQGHITREDMASYLAENSREIVQEQTFDTKRDDLLKDYDEQLAQDDTERDISRDHDIADDD